MEAIKLVEPGMLMEKQDALLIASTKKSDGGDGTYPYHVGVFLLLKDAYSKYVVWTIVERPEGVVVESGSYFKMIGDAVEHYKKNGGKATEGEF